MQNSLGPRVLFKPEGCQSWARIPTPTNDFKQCEEDEEDKPILINDMAKSISYNSSSCFCLQNYNFMTAGGQMNLVRLCCSCSILLQRCRIPSLLTLGRGSGCDSVTVTWALRIGLMTSSHRAKKFCWLVSLLLYKSSRILVGCLELF